MIRRITQCIKQAPAQAAHSASLSVQRGKRYWEQTTPGDRLTTGFLAMVAGLGAMSIAPNPPQKVLPLVTSAIGGLTMAAAPFAKNNSSRGNDDDD
jgi:hypothetical protein